MIPNVVFFLFGFTPDYAGKSFSLVHYLAVKSAREVNHPDAIYLYCKYEPSGMWWEMTRPYVQLVQLDPPTHICGRPLCHPAHQADVVRLQLLQQFGGIYLDIDVICVKPLTHLLHHPFVLGQQGISGAEGLCNAIILSEKDAFFARKWLEGFDPQRSYWQGFRSTGIDDYWCELSVEYPAFLAGVYPDAIWIEPHDSFHWPLYYEPHLARLFKEKGAAFPNALCHHLWETLSWGPYLRDMSITDILETDAYFHALARRFL